jgi:hypothetical protein
MADEIRFAVGTEYRRSTYTMNTKNRVSDERIVLYVFFACTTISWPTQRSFRPLKPELKVSGCLTRPKSELPFVVVAR